MPASKTKSARGAKVIEKRTNKKAMSKSLSTSPISKPIKTNSMQKPIQKSIQNPIQIHSIEEPVFSRLEEEKKFEEKTHKDKEEERSKKTKIKSIVAHERIVTENSNEARDLYNQSRYGVILENGQVQLSLHEALYLMEKGRLEVFDKQKKVMTFTEYLKRAKKIEKNFWIRYVVFKDMRNRGYIIKTALKFGADFRVYDRGVKPGEDHARWIVYPVHEASTMTWYDFAAKNRVAHSTKKRLLLAVVDEESDVTYWEVKWLRP